MKKIAEPIVYDGKWLSVHEIIYATAQNVELTWEAVRRKRSTMGIIIIARMIHSKKFILIKQYRPAINGYILSFPAGLGQGDPNHALVELKEETGYVGTIVSVSPVLKAGASLIDDSAYIVCADVDEHLPENVTPIQELEPAEDIKVCLVGINEARQFLMNEHAKGTQIASNLWYMFGMPAAFLS